MAKTKIGICDPNRDYAERFAYYVWHRLGDRAEAVAFTRPQPLRLALAAAGVEVVIVTEAFYRLLTQEAAGDCLETAETVVMLTETEGKTVAGLSCIYQYRQAEQILQEVLTLHRLHRKTRETAGMEGMHRYAVYSPLRRSGVSSLAEALAETLGQVGTVLAVSFEVLSAGSPAETGELTVSDLLYGAATHRNMKDLIRERESDRQMRRLGNPIQAEDLTRAGEENLCAVLDALASCGRRFLVADLGDLLLPPVSVFRRFDRIYVPVLQDGPSVKKLNSWQERQSPEEAELFAQRAQRLDLSFLSAPPQNAAPEGEALQELSALVSRLILEEETE